MTTAFDRVLAAFHDRGLKTRQTGPRKFSAQAPGHSAADLSVSVAGVAGRALVYSHSDPTEDVLDALGLRMRDLFDEPTGVEYVYRDEHGGRVGSNRRYVGADGRKAFRRSPGVRLPLFRLPELLEGISAGRVVYLCEGENDASSCAELAGEIATACPGASTWGAIDTTPLHAAKSVVIVRHQDDDGRRFAQAAYDDLRQHVPDVRIVEAAEGNDLADHLAAGHALADLVPVADAAQAEHDAAVQAEVARLRVLRDARLVLERELRPVPEPVEPVRLDLFLAEPDTDAQYRIDGLMPTGANVILAAQYKAGKSTLTGNLLASLGGGRELFLGKFRTVPAGRIILVDDELDPRTLRRWLRDHDIPHPERVELLSLRGRASAFDIIDAGRRARWAEALGPADVIILDCLRPVMDALGLDENREAGRFLVAWDSLKAEAGIDESIVVHHMGHTGERSRGDSRILDWPDVTWRIVRENDDPSSLRYFSAFGRDVDVAEGRLAFDPETRQQTYEGGSRREARDEEAVEDLKPAVLAFVTANPGCSGKQIEDGVAGGRDAIRRARDRLVAGGAVEVQERSGRGGGRAYQRTSPTSPRRHSGDVQTGTSPTSPQPGLGELRTSPTSPYRGEVEVRLGSGPPRTSPDGEVCTSAEVPASRSHLQVVCPVHGAPSPPGVGCARCAIERGIA